MNSSIASQGALAHPFTYTDLDLPDRRTGKVREIYTLSGRKLLIITTDRLSAFDRILGAVPYKGQVLNQLSAWWFQHSADLLPNHMLELPDPNALVAREGQVIPVEVVVRAYVTGVTKTSLWYMYSHGSRTIYGHRFPEGLLKSQALPRPIITPTTKAVSGAHDEALTCQEVTERNLLDPQTWEQVQSSALALFDLGQQVAHKAGLILVDTKYEFAVDEPGSVMLVDEVHTPDSSRYWEASSYQERFEAGLEPESFDKEYLRLEYARQGYRGDGEPPSMPDSLWLEVSQRYTSLYERLTGLPFDRAPYPVGSRLASNLRTAGYIP